MGIVDAVFELVRVDGAIEELESQPAAAIQDDERLAIVRPAEQRPRGALEERTPPFELGDDEFVVIVEHGPEAEVLCNGSPANLIFPPNESTHVLTAGVRVQPLT